MSKELGQRSDAELAEMFSSMYSGWERGVNVTQERFGNGDTRFTETPMTPMELAARYVAAEVGANIYEIAGRAAFAPIIVYSQIQARIGPVFEAATATLEAKDTEIEHMAETIGKLGEDRANAMMRAYKAELALAEAVEVLRPFAQVGDMLSFAGATDKDEIELSGDRLQTLIEAARQFVKEHSANAGQ